MTKKLIEVSLPLDVINLASEKDKRPETGAYHPKGIHHWWARLPLPTARAILFASLVDDPSSHPNQFYTEELQENERERLFNIIRRLCQDKIHTRQGIFEEAYNEISKQCNGILPIVLDPFAGGGSIPLEGMRLGLQVQASDLNPVAVLINKAALEILPKFSNDKPINPKSINSREIKDYKLAAGLEEDIKYYGELVNEEVKNEIGLFFPKIKIDSKQYSVTTWFWARTVKCPNPACNAEMPLVRSFILTTKKNSNFYVKPIIEQTENGNSINRYEVLQGAPEIKGTVKRSGAICVCCRNSVKLDYIRSEGRANRIGQRLIGMVAHTDRGKAYISPTPEQEEVALQVHPKWKPETDLPEKALGFRVQLYGIDKHYKLFTQRQLLGLSTLLNSIKTIRQKVITDGGKEDYADAICFFLALALDRLVDYNNTLTRWKASGEEQMQLFNRQTVPMVWDYPEANILEPRAISWLNAVNRIAISCRVTLTTISKAQKAFQFNAADYHFESAKYLISTDPPYYNNIGYSDLSDVFYVWLRKSLQEQHNDLLSTVLVPKMEELVASNFRYGSKEAAKKHFESGFRQAFNNFKKGLDPRFPLTVYYAFKQDEDSDDEESDNDTLNSDKISLTTGWETLLESLILTGFQITATWPIKASQKTRMVARDTNALATYMVLTCRPRQEPIVSITRREYLQILRRELPKSIEVLQHSSLAPVDMAQATIGPGMSIFSRYEKIMEQDGTPMTVRTALSLINKTLDEILAEQESDFDAETRWAIAWFEQNTFNESAFGDADALGRAKNTAVNALAHAGIVKTGGGKVKLISRDELKKDWDPTSDNRIVIWEMTQQLIKQLQENGEIGAALLYKKLGAKADVARELAYRLFTICEKRGWTQEAQAYNSLVLSWNTIVAEANNTSDTGSTQQKLDL